MESRRTDNLTKEQRSRNMRAIRSRDTCIEMILRAELSRRGHRYRLHSSNLEGKPDIVFPGKKVAIFCDSEFFHGYQWSKNKKKIHSNRDYWIPKIEKNMKRDAEITAKLKREGWIVLRFWGYEIEGNLSQCLRKIERALSAGPS